MKPVVSVCVITYNHQNYIAQALDSVYAQQGVALEVIISDDKSTDRTAEIIKEYQQKYPEITRVISAEKNVGMQKNWERCITAATGEYIALLEGDDFWNDTLKLKTQTDFLKTDAAFSACFTNANVINEVTDLVYPEYVTDHKEKLSFADFIESNNIPTCTVVFKNNHIEFPAPYFQSPYVDWLIHLFNAAHGDFYFMNIKTATYRLHQSGMYGGVSEADKHLKLAQTLGCIYSIYKHKVNASSFKARIRQSYATAAQLYLNEKKYFQHLVCRAKSKIKW